MGSITKYIIYTGDHYYPGVDEYDTLEDAMIAWETQKKRREGETSKYWDGDYIAQVIEYLSPPPDAEEESLDKDYIDAVITAVKHMKK